MNRDRFHGICKQVCGEVKEHWGRLTDDPLTVHAGTLDRLLGRIQEQRGISKQETDRQIEVFMRRHRNWRDLSGRQGSQASEASAVHSSSFVSSRSDKYNSVEIARSVRGDVRQE